MRAGAAAILRSVGGETERPRMVALMMAVLIPAIVAKATRSVRHAISRRSRDTFRRRAHGLLDALLTGRHLLPAPMRRHGDTLNVLPAFGPMGATWMCGAARRPENLSGSVEKSTRLA